MPVFKDMEDVEEWLEPLDYEAFWRETDVFGLGLQPRESCDRQIRSGKIDQATVLFVLKGMARLELIERFSLPVRITVPWMSLH